MDSQVKFHDQTQDSDGYAQATTLIKKLDVTDKTGEIQKDKEEMEDKSRQDSLSVGKEENKKLTSIIKKHHESTQSKPSAEKKIVHFADGQTKLIGKDHKSIQRLTEDNKDQLKRISTHESEENRQDEYKDYSKSVSSSSEWTKKLEPSDDLSYPKVKFRRYADTYDVSKEEKLDKRFREPLFTLPTQLIKAPQDEKPGIADSCSLIFQTKWLSSGCIEGQIFLMLTLFLIICFELDYSSKILIHRYERKLFIIGDSLKPIVYLSLLIHITLTLIQIRSFHKTEKCIDACLKSLSLSTQLFLAYCLIRSSLVSSKTLTPFSIIIPGSQIIVYSLLALYYQSPSSIISEETFDRLSQLVSPFVMILPVYFTHYCNFFISSVNLIVISCSIFLSGLIIWLIWTMERTGRVSYYVKKHNLTSRNNLIRFSLLPVRYPNFLGIIIMTIAWSLLACSFWSLLTPACAYIYLKYRASRLDKCFEETNSVVWKRFKFKMPNQIFPIQKFEELDNI